MIKDFKDGDELLININEHADMHTIRTTLADKRWQVRTIEFNEDIISLFFFRKYVGDHYLCFSVISNDITKRGIFHIRECTHKIMNDYKAKTVLTFCNKSGKLDAWHKFMGYEKYRNGLSKNNSKLTRWILRWA